MPLLCTFWLFFVFLEIRDFFALRRGSTYLQHLPLSAPLAKLQMVLIFRQVG